MATSHPQSPVDSAGFKILSEMICLMCERVYSDPVILPCMHYYCRSCLEAKTRESTATVCPKCHQEHELNKESIQKLPRGVLANNSVALHSIIAGRGGDVMCESCNSTSVSFARAYCQHCSKYLCSFCEEAHRRIKTYASHTVLNLMEIPSILENLVSNSSIAEMKMICSDHDEEMKVYCFDCNQLICRHCMLAGHKKHTCEFTKKAFEKVHKLMAAHKENTERHYECLIEHRIKIHEKISGVQKEGMEAADFVNKSFDIVLKQFEKYRSNLLQSICNKTDRDVSAMQRRSRAVEVAEMKVQPLLGLMQHHLVKASREEMLCTHKQICKQVSASQKYCQESLDSPVPQSEPFDMYRTSCARIIGAIGDSLRCADPIMCTVEGEGARRAVVGQETRFILRVNQSNEAPCTAIQNVHVDLNSIDSCQKCDTKVGIVRGCTYEVSYTPKLQGQHILKVRVNERPILGNPFHILVKRPLLDVKEPVLIIRGVKKLHDLALHQNGNLLATEYESGTVLSIDKKGRHMKALLSGVGRPFGITTNQQGWLFLSQHKKSCLQKYSTTHKLIETTGCKEASLGNFNQPGRMTINKKGEIFICDFKNSRIQVFDDDMEYLRWYSVSKPTGVAVDQEGDLYVIENGKSSLCKVFIASKRGMATIREGLANPQGVYVDKDYIYITEMDGGQVTVLDSDGDFVTALGKGVLRKPGGIVGDQDGYLYVCDEQLEAICVF